MTDSARTIRQVIQLGKKTAFSPLLITDNNGRVHFVVIGKTWPPVQTLHTYLRRSDRVETRTSRCAMTFPLEFSNSRRSSSSSWFMVTRLFLSISPRRPYACTGPDRPGAKYRETCRRAGVRKGCAAVAVVSEFTINRHVQIRYSGQEHGQSLVFTTKRFI